MLGVEPRTRGAASKEDIMNIRKAIVGVAIAGSAFAGGAVGAALLNGTAGAQTSTDTAPAATPAAPAPGQRGPGPGMPRPDAGTFDPAKGGHVGQNGVKEELLTGDTADKVTAAALAAVPGGSVERVETDAEGSPYEAHMTTSDGKHVTVKVDSGYSVTGIEDGPR